MKCPSIKRLTSELKITSADADLVRRLAKAVDNGNDLEALIEAECPATAAYARQCHNDPYRSKIWRVTMAMHAIDHAAFDGHGVEALGPCRSGDYAPAYEYCNVGDPYVATLIYTRETDTLRIGCWGDIAERLPARDRE